MIDPGISIPTLAKYCWKPTAVLARTLKTIRTSVHSKAPRACTMVAKDSLSSESFMCHSHDNPQINRRKKSPRPRSHPASCLREYLPAALQPHGFLVVHSCIQRAAFVAEGSTVLSR